MFFYLARLCHVCKKKDRRGTTVLAVSEGSSHVISLAEEQLQLNAASPLASKRAAELFAIR